MAPSTAGRWRDYWMAMDARAGTPPTIAATVAHVWHGNIFGLGDHLDRLLDGARKLRLNPGMTKAEIAEITRRCVSMSQLRNRSST